MKTYELNAECKLVPIAEESGLAIGQVVQWGGNMAWPQTDYCIIKVIASDFGGHYMAYNLDKPEDNAHLQQIEFSSVKREDDPALWHSQHFFVTDRVCTPEQVAGYLADHAKQAAEQERQKNEAKTESDRLEAEGRQLWARIMPPDTVAVIVARFMVDDSDLMTDYFASHATDLVILAASTHNKDNFREMRKAALMIPETSHLGPGCDVWQIFKKAAPDDPYNRSRCGTLEDLDGRTQWPTRAEAEKVLADAEARDKAHNEAVPFVPYCPEVPHGGEIHCESVEHREKYSGGHGYYLQDGGCNHGGWQVHKERMWNTTPGADLLIALAKRHDHLIK